MGVTRDIIRRVLKELNVRHPVSKINDIDNILKRVNKDGPGGCWIWLGRKCKAGYGYLTISRKRWRVHRIVYSLVKGEIATGMLVCHKCDNRICCNPDHMFIGTDRDNAIDCLKKNRSGRTKLKIEQVEEIKYKAQYGIPYKQLSVEFGVSCVQIKRIVKGHAWTFKRPKITYKKGDNAS